MYWSGGSANIEDAELLPQLLANVGRAKPFRFGYNLNNKEEKS